MSFFILVDARERSRLKFEQECSRCAGRGWLDAYVGEAGAWAYRCGRCGGTGKRFIGGPVGLARALGVHRRDILAVRTLRAGRKVALRVLDRIVENFPEALMP